MAAVTAGKKHTANIFMNSERLHVDWPGSSAPCEPQTQGSPHSLAHISHGALEKGWGQGQALSEPLPTPQIPLSHEAQTSDPVGGQA